MEHHIELAKPTSDRLTDDALDQATGGTFRITKKYYYNEPGANAQVWTVKVT